MSRVARKRSLLAVVPVVALFLVLGTAASAGAASGDAPADGEAAAAESTNAAEIEIPYRETAEIQPPLPWRISDCAGPRSTSALVVECDSEHITLSAPDYDPEAGTTVLPVALTDGSVSMTVAYRVSLAAPPAPEPSPSASVRPVASGSLLLVPFSDLGATCTRCGGGAGLVAVGVEPAEAGTAWATATHLVFRASASFTGAAEVGFGIADEFGTTGQGVVRVGVYRADSPLFALAFAVPLDGSGDAEIDLAALVTAIAGDDVVFVSCGAAIHGAAACDADGAARYTGTGEADQFGFQVAASGEQAHGSVTLVPAGTELPEGTAFPSSGPVPAAPTDADDEPVTTLFIPPVPAEQPAVGGPFDAFIAVLDRTAR
ncbi:hypothetical protein [Agromyces terreus]|uniref:hypothetical protein n=1 Tax=Agromyces terreus TaxID=424795 RepID=UPI0031D6A55F